MNIQIKINAQEDLKCIREYIARDSEFYADKTIVEIKKRILNLSYFPEIGKKLEINNIIARQIIYKSYRIFYQIDSNNIYILSIFHHSRDISNLKF